MARRLRGFSMSERLAGGAKLRESPGDIIAPLKLGLGLFGDSSGFARV